MRAARLVAPRRLELVEIPDPVRSDGHILVRLTRVTICGSDLHEFRGRTPRAYPWGPGNPAHECLGRVAGCDPHSGFSQGEIVLARPPGGGLRELALTEPKDLISVPDQQMDPNVAVMAQLLAPVIHCCNRLPEVAGRSVFIIGQGPAGLCLTNMIKLMDPDILATSDLVDGRREESIRRGADHACPGSSDVLSWATDITDGRMFDLVIEAVGDQETLDMAPRLVKQDGSLMLFGLPSETAVLRPRLFFGKQLHLTTTEYPEREDFDQALTLMASDQIDLGGMVTHVLPFGEVQRGFDLADSRAEGVLRVVLDMES